MKKLRFRREDLYPSDVAHIVSIMHDAGYDIHPKDAQDAWQAYSDSVADKDKMEPFTASFGLKK